MGSKGRIPPPHLRRPHSGPAIVHPEPFAPHGIPPPGAFHPFDMLPPPEVMEQKLAAQHVEMQKLATENQRLAGTHGTLRQELAAAQHELQIMHAQIGAVKSEKEQQVRSLEEKIAKMEADLHAAESVKSELQQAHTQAQNLVASRQELIGKAQQLSQDLQGAHSDVQQIPALMSELEALRQEYQHCRATYDYEKKLYSDHLETLQVMEKNYMTMAREVEKLRSELANTANFDRRLVGPYGNTLLNNENEASGHVVGQNAYEDGYGVTQVRGHFPPASGVAASAPPAASSAGTTSFVGVQPGPAPIRPGYDAPGGPTHDARRGPGYDPLRGPNYDAQKGLSYDSHRAVIYDSQRPGYDGGQRDLSLGGPGYDASRGAGYDTQSRGAVGHHGHAVQGNNAPYGSATPPGRGGVHDAPPPRGGNLGRR